MERKEPSFGDVGQGVEPSGAKEPSISIEALNELVSAAQSPKDQSQTAPQLNAVFRKMLLAKKWLEYRQASYNDAVRALHSGDKKPTAEQLEALAKSHFEFERQQLAGIAKSIQPGAVHDEAAAMNEDVIHSQLPPESVVALSYFSDDFERYVKSDYKELWAEFEKTITNTSNQMFDPSSPVSPPVQRAAAVEAMFKQEFPGLSDELTQKASVEGPHSHYGKALSLLKWTSVAVNPSGALLSYAVGAIMKTEAMSPLSKLVGDAVSHSQKVWLKPAAQKLMGFLPEKHAGKIITGMAMAGVAALYVTGVMTEDDVRQVASNVSDFVSNGAERLGSGLSNTMVGASELLGDFKEAHLGSLSLTDSVNFDAETSAVTQPGITERVKDLFTDGPSVAEQNAALAELFPGTDATSLQADPASVMLDEHASPAADVPPDSGNQLQDTSKMGFFERMKDLFTEGPSVAEQNVALGELFPASDSSSLQATVDAGPIEAEPAVAETSIAIDEYASPEAEVAPNTGNQLQDTSQMGFFERIKDLFTEGPSVAEQNIALAELFPMPDSPQAVIQAESLQVPSEHLAAQADVQPSVDNHVSEAQYSPEPSGVNTGASVGVDNNVHQATNSPATDNLNIKDAGVSQAATVDDVLKDLNYSEPDVANIATNSSSYEIQSGDCLSRIAEAQLKEAGVPYNYNVISAYVEQIAAHNDISNIHVIAAGDVLTLPPIEGASPQITPPAVVSPEAGAMPFREQLASGTIQMPVPGVPESAWGELVPPLIELPIAEDLLIPVSAQPQEIASAPTVSPKVRF